MGSVTASRSTATTLMTATQQQNQQQQQQNQQVPIQLLRTKTNPNMNSYKNNKQASARFYLNFPTGKLFGKLSFLQKKFSGGAH